MCVAGGEGEKGEKVPSRFYTNRKLWIYDLSWNPGRCLMNWAIQVPLNLSILSKRRLTVTCPVHIKKGKLASMGYNLKIYTDRNDTVWYKIFKEKQEIISMSMKYCQYYSIVYQDHKFPYFLWNYSHWVSLVDTLRITYMVKTLQSSTFRLVKLNEIHIKQNPAVISHFFQSPRTYFNKVSIYCLK